MTASARLPVLMVHNYYRSTAPSGENRSFEDEAHLLERHGHRVLRYTRSSDAINMASVGQRLRVGSAAIWAEPVRREIGTALRGREISVAHFQNTFPLISPAAYYACKAAGLAVVQSVRNFRLLCINAQLYRDRGPCERCVRLRAPWHGVRLRCYRDSRTASAVVAGMIIIHRMLGTWDRVVDVFVTPSEFTRAKLVEGGIRADKIIVKPNFVDPDPGNGSHKGGFGLFAGRLSEEKGVKTLLAACEQLPAVHGAAVAIAGEGPLAGAVQDAALRGSVRWLGALDARAVRDLMGEAGFVVVPSQSYETFGRVVVEAFARGTPVIAARLGALAELVVEGRTGMLFRAADVSDLSQKIAWALSHPGELAQMGRSARAEFEARYTAERNYEMLLDVYGVALSRPAGCAGGLRGRADELRI